MWPQSFGGSDLIAAGLSPFDPDVAALLNGTLPESALEQAVEKLTRNDLSRSVIQHNREFSAFIRDGVSVDWRDEGGELQYGRARVLDFSHIDNNHFLAVRELKIQGAKVPHYTRRADLVCFVNGLPLVFIELKAVHRNIRTGFDENLTDYLNESIPQPRRGRVPRHHGARQSDVGWPLVRRVQFP